MTLKKYLMWGFIIESHVNPGRERSCLMCMTGITMSRLGLQNIVSNLERVQRAGIEVILDHDQ